MHAKTQSRALALEMTRARILYLVCVQESVPHPASLPLGALRFLLPSPQIWTAVTTTGCLLPVSVNAAPYPALPACHIFNLSICIEPGSYRARRCSGP